MSKAQQAHMTKRATIWLKHSSSKGTSVRDTLSQPENFYNKSKRFVPGSESPSKAEELGKEPSQ